MFHTPLCACTLTSPLQVTEFVRLRIEALREEHRAAGLYQNAACLRTNCMRYFPNFFAKGQLEKIFFCFPDPHFKAKNHRRRYVWVPCRLQPVINYLLPAFLPALLT